MLFSNVKRQLIVVINIVRIQGVPVNEVGTIMVDNGTEAHPAAPTGRHVDYVHLGIGGGDGFTPRLQGLGTMQGHFRFLFSPNLFCINKVKL